MTIRWGRGLLRLWVVVAVLWIGGAGWIVSQDFTSGKLLTDKEFGITSGRGLTDEEIGIPPWDQLPNPVVGQDSLPQHQMPDAKFDPDAYLSSRSKPAAKLSPALFGWVFGLPVLLLLLGFAGDWIFRGFKM